MYMKKSFSYFLATITLFGIFVFNTIFPVKAEAFNLGGLIGAVISSSAQNAALNKYIKYYDTDGREKLFASYKKEYTTIEDVYLNSLLSDIVENISLTVAKEDISIIDRPYNYFIIPDESFNAACGLGHTMFVNKGVFTFLHNDKDMIAAVVAHEMVHGQQDHNLKGIKKKMGTIFARNVVASQLENSGGAILLDVITVNVMNTGITKPIEWEADNISYNYLTRSGYNPGAPAAVWAKIHAESEGKKNRNVLTSVLNPSTHPSSKDRRDNFSKKLTEFSAGNVVVDATTGEIQIKGKPFMTPIAIESMSGQERSYIIAGRLATFYNKSSILPEARANGDTLMVEDTIILRELENEPSVEELAKTLNEIQ